MMLLLLDINTLFTYTYLSILMHIKELLNNPDQRVRLPNRLISNRFMQQFDDACHTLGILGHHYSL